HRGEVLDRQLILDAVWPNLVVDDNNLSQAVSALRRTLGDDHDTPRFIATEPRRGYRFVAPVRVSDADAAEASASTASEAGTAAAVAGAIGRAFSTWRPRALVLVGAAMTVGIV